MRQNRAHRLATESVQRAEPALRRVDVLILLIAAVLAGPALVTLLRSAVQYRLARRQLITRLTLERDDVKISLDAAKPEDAEKIVEYFLSCRLSEELGPKE